MPQKAPISIIPSRPTFTTPLRSREHAADRAEGERRREHEHRGDEIAPRRRPAGARSSNGSRARRATIPSTPDGDRPPTGAAASRARRPRSPPRSRASPRTSGTTAVRAPERRDRAPERERPRGRCPRSRPSVGVATLDGSSSRRDVIRHAAARAVARRSFRRRSRCRGRARRRRRRARQPLDDRASGCRRGSGRRRSGRAPRVVP